MQPSQRYKALHQEKADLVKKADVILNNPNATAEELAEAAAITGTHDSPGKLAAINAQLAQFAILQEAERSMTPASSVTVTPVAEADPKRGFRDLGEFALAVMKACSPGGHFDERLKIGAAPTNFHKELGADEGAMVPPAFREEILEAVTTSDDSLLGMVDTEPTNSNSVEFLRDESTPWGATGVQAAWRSEGAVMSASKLATQRGQMLLHELYAFVLATGELLQDAPRLADRLRRKAALALIYKINEAIVNGTGAGTPLGWFASGAKVSVAKEGSQAADTVVAANVAKMYARLIDPGQGIWFVNQDVLPQLFTMTLANQPIWVPPGGIQNAPTGGFLFGRPVRTLENCATVGDQGDIQFVNPKGYYAAVKGGSPEFAESMHLFFDYNVNAFRWIFRLGGQPYLSAAVTPAKGSVTRSHFVVLDARA